MQASKVKIQSLVREIRKRWRRRALIQGLALTAIFALLLAAVLLLLYTRLVVPPLVLIGVAGVGCIGVLYLLVQYVLRPAFRKISDDQIALFIEEKMPALEDRLNSAIEVGRAPSALDQSAVIDRLLDDAAVRARALPLATIVDRSRARLMAYGATALLVLFLFFGYSVVDQIQANQGGITLASLTTPEQPFMTVAPGNIEIEKGASQEVVVELADAPDRALSLHYKEGDGSWQKVEMQAGREETLFMQELLNIQAPIQYFVEVDERRSDVFMVSLYEFPAVQQVDLRYRFPSYTGKSAEVVEDIGDIRGLKGSSVTLTVHTSGTVALAEMVMGEDRVLALQDQGDGRFQGTIQLDEDGYYRVRLSDATGRQNKFPDEYQIDVYEDQPPYINIVDPGRDVRANAVEEVLVAVTVEDDFGVDNVRLVYSVNAGEDVALSLAQSTATTETELAGEHLFFLEDFTLQPGDIISYYVEAQDHFHTEMPEATDMYFIEVIPFDQQFKQAPGGGGGMQGQQASGIVLNQQQIINATWKLHRQRRTMTGEDYDETRKGLVQAQSNLKDNINERINNTAFSLELRMNEDNRKLVDYLRQAVGAMDEALVDLDADALREALTPERQALNYLLRADALSRERQVAMNQQSGGGSGGAREERMSELMDLELDISKDKYEVQQQQPSRASQNQEVDEALQRIRELARKQQNLTNQARQDELQGEDKKRFLDRLKREQDEIRQQTEDMAQNMRQSARGNQQLSREMEQQLEQVADNMRQAERALRNEDVEQAMQRQQQAINALNRLQQELQMKSTDRNRDAVQQLQRDFEQLRSQERTLEQEIDEAAQAQRDPSGAVDEAELNRLREQREGMARQLKDLEAQAGALRDKVSDTDPTLAKDAQNIAQRIRREELERLMEEQARALGQGWLDHAARLEDEINTSMERLETQMRSLEGRLPVTEEETLARTLNDVRDLQRQFEELQRQSERLRNQQQGQQQQGQQQQGQQQGQQQQGEQQGQQQQGEQQGQAGGGGQPGAATDRQARANEARMRQQLDRTRETLDRLQRDMSGNPAARRQLQQMETVLDRVNDASFTGTRLEGDAAKNFFEDQIFAPLSQIENNLAESLDLIAMEKKLYGSRDADVPAEYRNLVEKYYEGLSKSKQ